MISTLSLSFLLFRIICCNSHYELLGTISTETEKSSRRANIEEKEEEISNSDNYVTTIVRSVT